MTGPEPYWGKISSAFHEGAEDYENWFNDNPVFESELSALLSIETVLAEPRLEIGIGPGLFAEKLQVSFGIDPAFPPLLKARKEGINACRAVGEQLPFADQQFGSIFLLFTLCFLEDPTLVFKECQRVLSNSGHLVLGMIPGSSSWGKTLTRKGKQGHPLYQHAIFHEKVQIETALIACSFRPREIISTLRQSPENTISSEVPRKGYADGAGLLIIVAEQIQTK